jgi:hypothetical protein
MKVVDGNYNPHIQEISMYVNPTEEDLSWSHTQLLAAFQHMCNFRKDLTTIVVYGQKTPDAIKVYNASMLYYICNTFDIRTTRDTTGKEMEIAINTFNQASMQRKMIQFINGKTFEDRNIDGDLVEAKATNKVISQLSATLYSVFNYDINNMQDSEDVIEHKSSGFAQSVKEKMCCIYTGSEYVLCKPDKQVDGSVNTLCMIMRTPPLTVQEAHYIAFECYGLYVDTSPNPIDEVKQIQASSHLPQQDFYQFTHNSQWVQGYNRGPIFYYVERIYKSGYFFLYRKRNLSNILQSNAKTETNDIQSEKTLVESLYGKSMFKVTTIFLYPGISPYCRNFTCTLTGKDLSGLVCDPAYGVYGTSTISYATHVNGSGEDIKRYEFVCLDLHALVDWFEEMKLLTLPTEYSKDRTAKTISIPSHSIAILLKIFERNGNLKAYRDRIRTFITSTT